MAGIATAQRPPARRNSAIRRALAGDFALYALSAGFAVLTAATSTLAPHRAWGSIAWYGYAAAALAVGLHRWWPTTVARAGLTVLTWVSTALVPLLVQAAQRASGRTDRAQEEVTVVEQAGIRLLHTGTPYLGRDAIAALPSDDRLLGYTPYQPGMALFGLPRALTGIAWWTDARVWFAVVTALALVAAGRILAGGVGVSGGGAGGGALVRALQMATVLPICALTLATGGDDLPVLALCLLSLALAGRHRLVGAGLTVGAAGALKLFAWPVAVVLLVYVVHAATAGRARRRAVLAFGVPAFGLPILVLLPAFVVDPDGALENVVRFPLGRGLVTSPAQSPLPGHLIAAGLPGGRAIAAALLVLAGLAIAAWLVRRPPPDAAAVAIVCAVGMTAAILLLPATRFGYLLYPIAYVAMIPALRPDRGRSTQVE